MPKVLSGVVTSTSMQDTIVVEVTRRTPHPLYKKLMKRSKKFKVDPAGIEVTVGQQVSIIETRKMSKDKYFKLKGGEEK